MPTNMLKMEAMEALEEAEMRIKALLENTPAFISRCSKNDQDLTSDALARTQAALRLLLKREN